MIKFSVTKFKKTTTLYKLLLIFLGFSLLMIPVVFQEIKRQNRNVETAKSGATQQIKAVNGSDVQSLNSATERSTPSENTGKPSAGIGNQPLNTEIPQTTSTQPPSTSTPEYVYQKPQCSNTLRASAINTLKQGDQTQANRKSIELGSWYSNNYQLPTYTHQQFLDREAENRAWLDNYIAIEIANKNASLNEGWVCTPITRSELGV